MKILWLSHNVPYPPIGGVLQRNYNLLKQISDRHSVHLIAFHQKALLPTEQGLEEAKAELNKLCAQVNVIKIPSERPKLSWHVLVLRSLFSKDPYTVNWLKSEQMRQTINKIVRNERFDIVHYDTISLAEYFGETSNIPKVLNHHNVESAMMLRRALNEGNRLKQMYFHVPCL